MHGFFEFCQALSEFSVEAPPRQQVLMKGRMRRLNNIALQGDQESARVEGEQEVKRLDDQFA
jgi:hypothetical protein